MNNYIKALENYEEFMTKEQMRIVCHISKRKAMYLLQSGLVPCINTGKKTHTYLVRKKDVIVYLKDRELNPWRYQISYAEDARKCRTAGLTLTDIVSTVKMRSYYTEKLSTCQDLLSNAEIAEFTGYGEKTVYFWGNSGRLRYLDCIVGWRIPKPWLIDFLCSEYFNKISRKTNQHLKSIEEMVGSH